MPSWSVEAVGRLRCRGRCSYLLVKLEGWRGRGWSGGTENGRRKRGTLPDGAEGPSRSREKGDERGWRWWFDRAPWVGFLVARRTWNGRFPLDDDETTRVNVAINALPAQTDLPSLLTRFG